MTPGREYGINKYGWNTYDHWRNMSWGPEPITPGEIWIPDTTPIITDPWILDTTVIVTEIWVPEVIPPSTWVPDV